MRWIETLTGNYSASASVVDGTLIISLPQAVTPVVWRMELGHVRASALEVRKQDNGTHVLTLKTPKGDVYDIAPFDTRGKAVQALMSVSRAMEQAHGQMRATVTGGVANDTSATTHQATATTAAAVPTETSKGRFVTGIIGTVLLLGLIAIFLNTTGPNPASSPTGSDHAASGGTAPAPATGVPLSADDFLNNR